MQTGRCIRTSLAMPKGNGKQNEQWGLQTPDIQVPRRIRRLPKAKTGTEAVAAALQVTTALGGAKKTPSPAKQAKKAKAIEKRKTKKVTPKAAEAATFTEEEAGEDSQSEETELTTPVRNVLTIGQRPARQSQLATREQRRGVVQVLAVSVAASASTGEKISKRAQKRAREERRQQERDMLRESMGRRRIQPTKKPNTSWGRMATLSKSLQRLQATMKGAVT